jgi:hypothetical protein
MNIAEFKEKMPKTCRHPDRSDSEVEGSGIVEKEIPRLRSG